MTFPLRNFKERDPGNLGFSILHTQQLLIFIDVARFFPTVTYPKKLNRRSPDERNSEKPVSLQGNSKWVSIKQWTYNIKGKRDTRIRSGKGFLYNTEGSKIRYRWTWKYAVRRHPLRSRDFVLVHDR